MKTIQKTIIFMLLGIITLHLSAQTPTENQFIALKTHSIGLNLYPIIDHLTEPASLLPFEITYKHQLKGKNRAWRFGLLGQYNDQNQDGNMLPQEDEAPSYNFEAITKLFKVGAYAGHEWQWTLGKRWLLATGADVRYLYEQRNEWNSSTISRSYVSSEPATVENYGNNYSHGVSLQPFIGLNFAITSHWLLYIDFKVDFTCNYTTTDSENSRQVPTTKTSSNSTSFLFNLLPLQQINLIYSF
ncbi:MAG: hypothetical protein LBU42_03350 [Prevotellaceae bacterium]|jgi:hypothetical protein|nr:hypothetical protein [Prevotellaceae bacterium]